MFLGGEDTILERASERRAEIFKALSCTWQTEPLLWLIPNRNLKGQVKEGSCLSVGEGEKAYFFFTDTISNAQTLVLC